MRDEVLATVFNMPLLRKLHMGAALLIVAIATINGGITGFVFAGLWMASSFFEKTRWLFYGMLLVQAWSNWHIIGLLLSAGFIVFCVNRSIAYKKQNPNPLALYREPFRTREPFQSNADYDLDPLEERRRDQAKKDDEYAHTLLMQEEHQREQEVMKEIAAAEYDAKLDRQIERLYDSE